MSKTILMTGAAGTLGFATIKDLVHRYKSQNFHFLLTARNPNSNEAQTVANFLSSQSIPHTFLALDLASLSSVRTFTHDILQRLRNGSLPPLQVLIHTAGYQTFSHAPPTPDGLDRVYESNFLGPFLLTLQLLPELQKEGDKARIIFIGTTTHLTADPDLYVNGREKGQTKEEGKRTLKEGLAAYGASKLLMIIFAFELRRWLVATSRPSPQVLTLDPGGITTATRLSSDTPFMLRASLPLLRAITPIVHLFDQTLINPVEVIAVHLADMAAGDDYAGKSGYWLVGEERGASEVARDEKQGKRVWVMAVEQLVERGINKEEVQVS